jgi:hypothetical protein
MPARAVATREHLLYFLRVPTLPLHTAGRDGRCEHCGQTWPRSEGRALFQRVRDQVDDTTPGDVEQDCICTTAARAQGRQVEECPLFNAWPDSVKPRRRDPNPRCHSCSSPDPNGRLPMFHPEHRWGPCEVRLPGGTTAAARRRPAAPPFSTRQPYRLAPPVHAVCKGACCRRATSVLDVRAVVPASVLMLRMIAVGRRDVLDVIDVDQEAVTGS